MKKLTMQDLLRVGWSEKLVRQATEKFLAGESRDDAARGVLALSNWAACQTIDPEWCRALQHERITRPLV